MPLLDTLNHEAAGGHPLDGVIFNPWGVLTDFDKLRLACSALGVALLDAFGRSRAARILELFAEKRRADALDPPMRP